MLARYFMYSQVYLHHIRRIYDIHLKDFLKRWLKYGVFSTDISDHLSLTDEEIISAFWAVAFDEKHSLHEEAKRIVRRYHFKVGYERNPSHYEKNPNVCIDIFKAACIEFGTDNLRYDCYFETSRYNDFPVKCRNNEVVSCTSISSVFNNLPVVAIEYIFVNRDNLDKFTKWIKPNINDFIKEPSEEA